ncbi:MAG: DUF4340 domain-containing protein [bacterium]
MKESKFTVFITFTLLILTLLLAIYFLKDYLKTKEDIKEKTFLEKKFKPENLNEIYIYSQNEKVIIKKEGDFWYIVYPFYDLAYSYKIQDIINNLYQPTVNQTLQFSNDLYNQVFNPKKQVYFKVNNYIYEIEIGQKNTITNEYYVYIKKPLINKIFLVDYFSYNYFDSNSQDLRLNKILNIDPKDISKVILYHNNDSYVINKKEIDKDNYLWYIDNDRLVSKSYIENLFAFLNNYEVKKFIDNFNIIRNPVLSITVYYKQNPINIEIIKLNDKEVLVKNSLRKPYIIMDINNFKELENSKIIEDKIFSYDLDNTNNVEKIVLKTSSYSYTFEKKDNKWFNVSYKDKEKTGDITIFLSTLSNIKYKNYWNYYPLKNKYELYTVELKIKLSDEKKYRTLKFFLYNPNYLAKGNKVYEIDSLQNLIKNLIKFN